MIDSRLKNIYDEFNYEVSNLITQFLNNKIELNYDILKDAVFDYFNKVIKCETPVTNNLKLLGKQINSPRIRM